MPPRRAQQTSLPAVNSPVLVDYSEQLAILLFGQLMKWLRPLVRRGDSIPLADLKDALWAVKAAWELHRDIARASGPQPLTEVPAEELDALTAGYDPLIDAGSSPWQTSDACRRTWPSNSSLRKQRTSRSRPRYPR